MRHRKTTAAVLLASLAVSSLVPAYAASPAEMISAFRLQHGEKRVTEDSKLTQIARDQAAAMAAKDSLDHDVLGRFSNRISPSGAGSAAENIAYGYDNFPKTLTQWIESSGHRKNLLLRGATRVGIASAKSSATNRIYWAMEIAGDYDRRKKIREMPMVAGEPKVRVAKTQAGKTHTATTQAAETHTARTHTATTCRLKILSLCL
jgi:hypothetical protein